MAVPLQETQEAYDVIVIGSGLGGLTTANMLARSGHSVLLLEHHHRLGGLATWFKRKTHIFDVSLHGFPYGMVKTCKKYWNREIMDSIVQLKHIRFDNPMFSLSTTFDRKDFTRQLVDDFAANTALATDQQPDDLYASGVRHCPREPGEIVSQPIGLQRRRSCITPLACGISLRHRITY